MKQPTQKIKKLDDLKFFPTGSNWKNVLLEVYNHSPHNYGESHKVGFYDNNHPIAKRLRISGYELGLAISFLRDHKLIEDNNKLTPLNFPQINANWSNMVFLTDRGFDVSTKLENELSNQKTQNVIMIFTAIITWTGLIALIKDIIPTSLNLIFWSYIVIILLLLFSFYFNNFSNKIRRFIFNRQINKQRIVV
ncbi:Uncharacterised protein [uncultured archaeon]|nr:Uncharacterised protein [uncultured archaeon]